METFQSPATENKTLIGFNSAGKMSKSISYDTESQAAHGDFKRPPY